MRGGTAYCLLLILSISTFVVTVTATNAANFNTYMYHRDETDDDKNNNNIGVMPLPEGQKWAHGVCSHAKLENSLSSTSHYDIDSDLILGDHVLYEYDDHNNKNAVILERNVPINAHPPRHRSDLSVVEFLDAVFGLTDENVASYVQQQQEEEEDDNGVSHHTRLPVNIKLDMKELQVVQPAMELLLEKYPHMLNTVPSANTTDTDSDSEAQDENENDKADDNNPTSNLQYIYLNADVMPGPGHRFDPPTIDGDAFLSTCTDVLRANPRPNAELVREVSFFSLGWHVSYLSAGFSTDNAYTNADVQNMVDLIRRYNLDGNGGTADADDNSGGIVLAVNARLLYNDCTPFDAFLDSIPTAQLLVWTGTGELPIPQDRIDSIQAHFQSQGTLDRIGFDCKIATTQLGAIW
eukprot:CAMPEP_0116019638 /NCGR_PEP_ID=MMETSP0321-20121206/9349_1 /TAXON_ID=163516 /ORGANISM="Leptocylindrus danicus var. danicus, Strain B650" /LENGTH=407 /DNA_ID=CAMNT_0003490233 /DNA_START=225 /DNA_END=1445 /DNA_ORIENTATION=+